MTIALGGGLPAWGVLTSCSGSFDVSEEGAEFCSAEPLSLKPANSSSEAGALLGMSMLSRGDMGSKRLGESSS